MIVDHFLVKARNLVYFIVIVYPESFRAVCGLQCEKFFVLIELAVIIGIYDPVGF
jgi:hypothetical protein